MAIYRARAHEWKARLDAILRAQKRYCDWLHFALDDCILPCIYLCVRKNYSGIRSALQQLANDTEQTATTRNDANSLNTKMETLEMAVLCVVWDYVLQRFNATSEKLQKVNIDLGTCVSLYESLHAFVSSIRTAEAFTSYEDKAKLMVEDSSYREVRGPARKKKRLFNEVDSEVYIAVSQGKIQNFNIYSHVRFFGDGISSEKKSVFEAEAPVWLSVHLADIF